ncbi:hypothetical protein PsYK624_149920 [Phanerochaete sordida]|uniref:Uncharacterized protein n=1 Tax=Phanerochaete sordida TaxID=48140 RepID=A0A9P3LKQ1_9APHY|nr:hypothetical protein PsYK624_149920 [Phanerochaete sordida]
MQEAELRKMNENFRSKPDEYVSNPRRARSQGDDGRVRGKVQRRDTRKCADTAGDQARGCIRQARPCGDDCALGTTARLLHGPCDTPAHCSPHGARRHPLYSNPPRCVSRLKWRPMSWHVFQNISSSAKENQNDYGKSMRYSVLFVDCVRARLSGDPAQSSSSRRIYLPDANFARPRAWYYIV